MATLTRRLQVLLEEDRYRHLERLAAERNASVATLVREALQAAFPEQPIPRAEAGRRLLEAAPIAVGDWSELKAEIEGMYEPAP